MWQRGWKVPLDWVYFVLWRPRKQVHLKTQDVQNRYQLGIPRQLFELQRRSPTLGVPGHTEKINFI
jgi:hypothetical protein